MSINVQYETKPLRWFLEELNGDPSRYQGNLKSSTDDVIVYIPDHQREYVWKIGKQSKLIDTLFRGFPIPAIIVTQTHRVKYGVQDGQQRLETFYRFYTNKFTFKGKSYRQLSEEDQKKFLEFKIPIIDITGVSADQESEIYDRLNQGMALSHGEKFYNRRKTALVSLTEELLLTPEKGLHGLATEVWGNYMGGSVNRHARLANAVAYIAGAAYGSEYISTSFEKLSNKLDGIRDKDNNVTITVNKDIVKKRISALLSVYKAADMLEECSTGKDKSAQAKIGKYSAFILHSLMKDEQPTAQKKMIDLWAYILSEIRRSPSKSKYLYKGMTRGINIGFELLEKGYKNILDIQENGMDDMIDDTHIEEDSDDESSDE